MSSPRVTLEVENNLPESTLNSSPDSSLNPIATMTKLSEEQGDQIEEKRNDVFRIGFVNINGIPNTSKTPRITT